MLCNQDPVAAAVKGLEPFYMSCSFIQGLAIGAEQVVPEV